MGGLQGIKPVQLAPADKDTSVSLVGIESRACFGTA